jgi:hypothetical protein
MNQRKRKSSYHRAWHSRAWFRATGAGHKKFMVCVRNSKRAKSIIPTCALVIFEPSKNGSGLPMCVLGRNGRPRSTQARRLGIKRWRHGHRLPCQLLLASAMGV